MTAIIFKKRSESPAKFQNSGRLCGCWLFHLQLQCTQPSLTGRSSCYSPYHEGTCPCAQGEKRHPRICVARGNARLIVLILPYASFAQIQNKLREISEDMGISLINAVSVFSVQQHFKNTWKLMWKVELCWGARRDLHSTKNLEIF